MDQIIKQLKVDIIKKYDQVLKSLEVNIKFYLLIFFQLKLLKCCFSVKVFLILPHYFSLLMINIIQYYFQLGIIANNVSTTLQYKQPLGICVQDPSYFLELFLQGKIFVYLTMNLTLRIIAYLPGQRGFQHGQNPMKC